MFTENTYANKYYDIGGRIILTELYIFETNSNY